MCALIRFALVVRQYSDRCANHVGDTSRTERSVAVSSSAPVVVSTAIRGRVSRKPIHPEGSAGAGPGSHRRSLASRRIVSMLAPSLAASCKTMYRFIVSRSDSAHGRGELSVGRSADPRRIAEARNRHFETHGLASSARPPDSTVTNLAYIPREPPR